MPAVNTEPTTSATRDERRRHKRARLFAVAYLHLGNGKGGLILNIAEEGMAIRAEIPHTKYLREIRFSIPNTPHYVVCDGEVAWLDTQRKRAGIHFASLSNSDREKIQRWVFSQSAEHSHLTPSLSPPAIVKTPNTFDFAKFFPTESEVAHDNSVWESPDSEIADAGMPPLEWQANDSDLPPGVDVLPVVSSAERKCYDPATVETSYAKNTSSVSGADEQALAEIEEKSATAAAFNPVIGPADTHNIQHEVPLEILREEVFSATRERSYPQPSPPPARTNKSRPALIAAGGFLGGLLVATAFILSAFPSAKSRLISSAHRSRPTQISISGEAHPAGAYSSAQETPKQQLPVLETRETMAKDVSQTRGPDSSKISNTQRPVSSFSEPVKRDAATSKPSAEGTHQLSSIVASRPIVQPPATKPVAPNVTVATQPTANIIPEPVLNAEVPPIPQNTAEPKVTTSVQSSSQFAAIHMPNGDANQISGDLQIGPLVSSREPEYPAPAAQAGIQGIVKLHATVGTDGNVERVEPVSGPSELIHSAMVAAQEWQFGPTIIAGKAVESERNIVFVFRVVN